MNADTAQALLHCYRPGKRADPRMEKALRFVEDHPELKQALNGQIEFDGHISEVIHCIIPPENLGQKLSELSEQPRAEQASLRKQVVNPAVLTALLGGIVILGIVVFLIIERVEKFPGREAVEGILASASKMNGTELESVASTAGQLADWFYMRGYDGYEAPADLTALPAIGSRVFRIDGRTIGQVAISNADPVNPGLRCLIFEFHASEFGVQLPPDADWQVLTQDEWVGAIRQRGDHCFLIAFRGGKGDMQEFLKSLPAKKS